MAQRSIEVLIGRVLTDEAFRKAFLRDGPLALRAFVETGHELTALEITAVLNTPRGLWSAAAERIDSRLQKAALTTSEMEGSHEPDGSGSR